VRLQGINGVSANGLQRLPGISLVMKVGTAGKLTLPRDRSCTSGLQLGGRPGSWMPVLCALRPSCHMAQLWTG
jgi:hypothetical protein